ncbi:MAG: PorT family protein [Bacteroidales bacterium]|jgi:hypothetical protein|nr:PorT family protein [Bacteroidales bacterium]
MKTKKKIFGLLLCALMPLTVCAQHEISIDGGGGISMMLYRGSAGNKKINLGYAGGFSYVYFSPDRTVAFRTGLEVINYAATMTANGLKEGYKTYDMDGEPIIFRYKVNDYTEDVSAMYLQLPVLFQFMNRGHDLISKHRFYADIGFKFGIPVNARLKINSMNMTSSGYYLNYDSEIEEPRFMGYGTFDIEGAAPSKIKLGVSINASIELGIRWHLYNKMLFLYTGLYCDYGLTNLAPVSRSSEEGGTHLINYNPEDPTAFTSNSLFFANKVTEFNETVRVIKRVSPLAAGLRIRIGIFMEKPASKIRWARHI